MSRRRRDFLPRTVIDSDGIQVAFTRDIHQDVLPIHTTVMKFIAGLNIAGIELMPKTDATQVMLLHSETVKQFYLQRKNSKTTIDTEDLLDLEYHINDVLGTEAPAVTVLDEYNPLRIDDQDRLVLDLNDSNELQIDRCRILHGLGKVINSRRYNARDIDGLLRPVAPFIPLATVDRRILGKDFEAITADPVQYFYDESLARLDTAVLPIDAAIPDVLPLGKVSVRAVPKQVELPPLEEHFPDIAFDGVKRIPTHEMEYS